MLAERFRMLVAPLDADFIQARLIPAASWTALIAICLHWSEAARVIAGTDYFPSTGAWTLLHKAFWSWSILFDPNGMSFSPVFNTYYAVTGLLNHAFGDTIGQVAYSAILLILAWHGTWSLCRRLGIPPIAAAVAAWAYVLNPYDQFYLVTFLTGTVFSATLPWLLLILLRVSTTHGKHRRETLWVAVISALAIPIIAATPQLFFELLLAIAAWVAYLYFRRRQNEALLKWAGVACLWGLAASLWWLVPTLIAFHVNTITHSANVGDLAWTYANASLLNDLRFLGAWTWPHAEYFPYSAEFDRNPFLYLCTFTLFIASCLAVAVVRGKRAADITWFSIAALLIIFLSKGLHEPFSFINAFIYKIPPFFLLIEPAGLLIFALLLLSLNCGLLIAELSERERRRNYAPFVAAALIAGVVASASPVVTGEVFKSSSASASTMHVRIPSYWAEAARYFSNAAPDATVLVAPDNASYQASYAWGYRGVDLIPNATLQNPVMMLGAPLSYLTGRTYVKLNTRIVQLILTHSPLAESVLKSLGIRFVLDRGDLVRGAGEVRPADLRATLRDAKVLRFGPLVVYDLGAAPPPLVANAQWIALDAPAVDAGGIMELNALTQNVPRISPWFVPAFFPRPIAQEINTSSNEAGSPPSNQNAPSGLPMRRVFYMPQGNERGLLRAAGIPVQVSASFGRIPQQATALYVGPDAMQAPSQHDYRGEAFLTSGGLTPVSLTTASFSVFNPSSQTISSTLKLAVRTSDPERITIASGESQYTQTVPGAGGTQIAVFPNVTFSAGPSTYQVTFDASAPPPAKPIWAPADIAAGSVFFSRRIPIGRAQSIFQQNAEAILSQGTMDHALVAELPLDTHTALHPILTLDIAQNTLAEQPGMTLQVSSGAHMFLCNEPALPNIPVDASAAIARCFLQNGLHGADRATIRRVFVDVSLAPGYSRSTGSAGIVSLMETLRNPLADAAAFPAGASLQDWGTDANWSYADGTLAVSFDRRPKTLYDNFRGTDAAITTSRGTISGMVVGATKTGLTVVDTSGRVRWVPVSSIQHVALPNGGNKHLIAHFRFDREMDPDGVFSAEIDMPGVSEASASFGYGDRTTPPIHLVAAGGTTFRTIAPLKSLLKTDRKINGFTIDLRLSQPPPGSTGTIKTSVLRPVRQEITLGRTAVRAKPRRGVQRALAQWRGGPAWAEIENASPEASLVTVGPRLQAAPSKGLAKSIPALVGVAQVDEAKPVAVVMRQNFSRTWLAVLARGTGLTFPPGVQVNGWEQGWLLPAGGTLVILNLQNLLQLILMVGSAGVMLLLYWRVRRANDSRV